MLQSRKHEIGREDRRERSRLFEKNPCDISTPVDFFNGPMKQMLPAAEFDRAMKNRSWYTDRKPAEA